MTIVANDSDVFNDCIVDLANLLGHILQYLLLLVLVLLLVLILLVEYLVHNLIKTSEELVDAFGRQVVVSKAIHPDELERDLVLLEFLLFIGFYGFLGLLFGLIPMVEVAVQ